MRYPLFLDVAQRRVVVVGGGRVALRRTRTLLDAAADVRVVAPDIGPELVGLAADAAGYPGQVTLLRRRFAPEDLDGAWLAHACTDDSAVNAAVAAAAADRHVWCARADDAWVSAAWVPAGGAVDDVHVAVTAGADPARAARLRDEAVRALRAGEWSARRGRASGGRVVLVGGGPGDPDLLTLRGYRALLDADVVVTDRLGPTDLLTSLPDHIEVVDVGKDPRGRSASQDDINALLVEQARAGRVVVRLKGGDPFVLGRGAEEVAACTDAGVAVEVVPGVSSATAAATIAGVPLTRRGTTQQFAVVSGHVAPGDPRSTVDWAALGASTATLVLLMAVTYLDPIAAALVAGGRPATTPVLIVENASLPEQRTIRGTLADIAAVVRRDAVVPPAIIIVGDVVDDPARAAPPSGPAPSGSTSELSAGGGRP